jgi:hypothetical protein
MSNLQMDPLSAKAFRRAATPTEYSTTKLKQLFQLGMDQYRDSSGEVQIVELVETVEDFALHAMDLHDGNLKKSNFPTVGTPAELALAATWSTLVIKNMDKFSSAFADGGNGQNIQPLHDIRYYYSESVLELIKNQETEFELKMLQDIAEVLYKKKPDEESPYPGRTVTDIIIPEGSSRRHLEIPIVAASMDCIDYSSIRMEPEDVDVIFDNNCLYVPVSTLENEWGSHIKKGFAYLIRTMEEILPENTENQLMKYEERIRTRIEAYDAENQYGRLYRNYDPDEQTIQTMRHALEKSDIPLGDREWLSANEINRAIARYRSEGNDTQKNLVRFNENRTETVAQFLLEHKDNRLISVQQTREGYENKYFIDADGGAKNITVNTLEDILTTLPCFAEMDQYYQENGPQRKDLWNLVRMVLWLDKYYDDEKDTERIEKAKEDLHDLFERWPWYDEQITEMQINYEYERGKRKKRFNPMGCHNKDMERFCIGKQRCPYSIYGSLNFTQRLFDRLDDELEGF